MSFNPANWAGDCTFGSVAFLVDEPSALNIPMFGAKTIKGVRSVPYASPPRNIIQITGREPATLTLSLTILTTDYPDLFAKVGTTDTLTLQDDAPVAGVLLDELGGPMHDPFGLTFVTATFISG